jgi:hypothetical protein
MSRATIAPPEIKTLADLKRRLGGIPLERIWVHPAPGTATENDLIEAEARESCLCELVDGTLVEKAMGFEESRLARPSLPTNSWLLAPPFGGAGSRVRWSGGECRGQYPPVVSLGAGG